MSAGSSQPAVFTIPSGAPFLDVLADAMMSGRLVEFSRSDPLGLADVTVFLPTRRAVRAFRDILVQRLGDTAAILPDIRPIGDVDEEEHLLAEADHGRRDLSVPAEPISPLARRLALTRLTLAWARSVRRPLLGIPEGEAIAIPASTADAARLAGDLARLIDDVQTAGIGWDALNELAPADHARYFQITLDFLKIVSEAWPAHLAEIGRVDPAVRRDLLIRAEAARLEAAGSPRPVIAAGSTGTIPATAALLRAIARSPAGAVVLPGLDQSLDDAGWAAIDDTDGGGTAVHGHPQFGLKKLIGEIGIERQDVEALSPPSGPAAARGALLSHAMRVSQNSDGWAAARPALDSRAALAGMDLLIARNEQEEATAIAIALRESVERPGQTAALVTPDRALARRVATELHRWGLDIDDSAGGSLDRQPTGQFCRLVTACMGPQIEPVALLSLLKHPLAAMGLPGDDCRAAAQAIEMAVLRGERFDGTLASLPPALQRAQSSLTPTGGEEATKPPGRDATRVPESRRRMSPDDWRPAEDLAHRLLATFAPVAALIEDHPGGAKIATVAPVLTELLVALAADRDGEADRLWRAPGGEALARLLTDLMEDDYSGELVVPWADFPAFLTALMADIAVAREPGSDPRLHIWGTLEARLQSVDLLVLGGLDEGLWPAVTRTDPWLSRAMRESIGLAPPERRLGLAAHDFVQGVSAARVICTRAERRGGAPTVETRWLQRLRAVVGETEIATVERRGSGYVALARAIDREADQRTAPVARPDPKPPLDVRPRRLAITEIETLIRDPYAVYAKRILRLRPLDPIGMIPDRALRGSLFHDAVGNFIGAWTGAFDEAAAASLAAISRDVLATVDDTPEIHAIWSMRLEAIGKWLIAWEAERDDRVARRHSEIAGELVVALPSGDVKLIGRADRIDLMKDGTVAIYDYKTGTPPTDKQVFAGLVPQMTLEAAMVRAGAFDEAFAGLSVSDLAWLGLGRVGRDDPYQNAVTRGQTPDDLADRALALFTELAAAYGRLSQGYRSRARPMLERARFQGDYDHLARVQEWSLVETEDDFK